MVTVTEFWSKKQMFESSKTAGFERDRDILFRYSSVCQNSSGGNVKSTAEDKLKDQHSEIIGKMRSALDVNVDLYS